MKCLCGCGEEVNKGRSYISGPHAMRGKIPWNKKYPDKWQCEQCSKMFTHEGHKMRFCSPECWGKYKIGHSPWNKGIKGRQPWHNTTGLIMVKQGNTQGFQKGVIPNTAWKKGHKPWNYIDGRSIGTGPQRYGSDWKKIRTQILIRDDFKCRNCGKHKTEVKRLEVHHNIPFIVSQDNSDENLRTLCPSCHRKADIKIRACVVASEEEKEVE